MRAQFLPVKVRRPRQRRPSAAAMTASPAPEAGAEAYRLSRIQAEGWHAAHRVAANTLDGLDGTQIESLNPYASDPERTRWHTGFMSALIPESREDSLPSPRDRSGDGAEQDEQDI